MIESNPRFEEPRRQGSLSLWLLGIILLFVALSIYSASIGAGSLKHAAAGNVKTSETDLDDQAVQDLISVDLQVKGAFLSSFTDGKPSAKSVREAVTAANDLDYDTRNAPFAARRLILVRALAGLPPLTATKRGRLLPLDAFGPSLPADYSAKDRADYARESSVWLAAFGPSKLTSAQAKNLAADIRRLPNLKWWRYPALYAVYSRADDVADAKKAVTSGATQTLVSMGVASFLMMLKVGMMLAGFVLLIVLIVGAVQRSRTKQALDGEVPLSQAYGGYAQNDSPNMQPPPYPQPAYPNLSAYGQPGIPAIAGMPIAGRPLRGGSWWKTEPEPIAPAERKLTSADLLGAFLVYLLGGVVLSSIVAGSKGFGPHHLFQFNGLLTPYTSAIKHMPSGNRIILAVAVETAMYIISGGVPILWLAYVARKRGASLRQEIGLPPRFSPIQILYGAGGYCIGLPLMMAVAIVAPRIFHRLPSPSNPAIPQLMSANNIVAGILLILLASFAAPFFEETLFRGILYNGMKLRMGAWPAILLSGFVFGFIHPVGVAEMFPLAVLGCVFAWMAETRKSLAPSMVAHCINNLTTSLLLFSLMQQ